MKTMYALTYCFEGYDDSNPYSSTIAVSEDRDALIAEMESCVEEDCRQPEEGEEWDSSCNYSVYKRYGDTVMLKHNKIESLYTKYRIQSVKLL